MSEDTIPADLPADQLRELLARALGKIAELERLVSDLRAENARLKGLKGRPSLKPSGLEKATEAGRSVKRRGRGRSLPRAIIEDRIMKAAAPPGSRFKGYESYLVQDLVVSAQATRYRRERWVTAGGATIVAPLPAGIGGHFGANLRRFVLMMYHQGQTTLPRLTGLLRSIGVAISKRQVQRLLTERQDGFLAEAREVLRAGLAASSWISVDDTGARHKAANGFCTQIGNDRFTWFGTRTSKDRLNILDLLRAGHTDLVLNEAAFAYMRAHGLSAALVRRLTDAPERQFSDEPSWQAHLTRLGIAAPAQVGGKPPRRKGGYVRDAVRTATEGARWGSVQAHGFLRDGVLLSDDARQFDFGRHALCWVHAERLVHRLDTFTDQQRTAQARVRSLIWAFYAELKAYRASPGDSQGQTLRQRFDSIFRQRTGFTALDRLLGRLHAKEPDLLRVLEQPEIPLHTNGSENDIRCHVTRRKVSAGTRSDAGRDCRDAFLGLYRTCAKLGVSFWDYLGDRLRIQADALVPSLPGLLLSQAKPP